MSHHIVGDIGKKIAQERKHYDNPKVEVSKMERVTLPTDAEHHQWHHKRLNKSHSRKHTKMVARQKEKPDGTLARPARDRSLHLDRLVTAARPKSSAG